MIYVNLGSVIAIKQWWGEHWGIVAADQFGQTTIVSNRGLRGGVTEELWQEVVGDAEWRIVDLSSQLPAYFIVGRARSKIGARYDFWTWNCQDLVYWALGLKAQSPQRNIVTAVLAIASVGIIAKMAAKAA